MDGGRLSTGSIWTALRDDVVLALGGIVGIENGVGGWVLFTDQIRPGEAVSVIRRARRAVHDVTRAGIPFYADVAPRFHNGQRMARVFGFVPVGTVTMEGRELTRCMAT